VALGAYFGVQVRPVVERLLAEQMGDGGWNTCSAVSTTCARPTVLRWYEKAAGNGC
jgi:hypothetical protein